MSLFDLLPAWPALLLSAALGRVVLSLLPPGDPGGHGARSLPATWAASHVLGGIVFGVQLEWCALVGVEASVGGHLAPWVVVTLVRLWLLPGAAVPRHPPAEAAAGPLEKLGTLALAASIFWLASRAAGGWSPRVWIGVGSELGTVANHAALCLLTADAVRCLRRAPGPRVLVIAAMALGPILAGEVLTQPHVVRALACLGAAVAGGVRWMRRADRRGRALAILSGAGLAVLDPRLGGVAACLLVGLVVASARPARSATALLSGAGAAFFGAPLALQDMSLRGGWPGAETWRLPLPALLFLALGLVGLGLAARPGARETSIQAPGRELVWLVLALLAVALGPGWPLLVSGAEGRAWLGLAARLALPVGVVLACAGWLPAEEPT